MRTLKSLSRLSGRRALITGAAGHIGQAVAEGLVEWGARVAVLDRDSRSCVRASTALNRVRRGAALPFPCDLADEASVRATVRQCAAKMGGLDILVHCAAFVGTSRLAGWAEPFERQSLQAWDAAMRVNVGSVLAMIQEAHKPLARSGHGSVVLFSSIYGLVGPDFRLYKDTGMANPAAYGASKGALLQLTRYLATLLAPKIRVNAVSPGGVWRGQPDVFHRRYRDRTPLGRMATEEDLKGAVAYLASDLSAYVTGQNLVVDGGWTAW